MLDSIYHMTPKVTASYILACKAQDLPHSKTCVKRPLLKIKNWLSIPIIA